MIKTPEDVAKIKILSKVLGTVWWEVARVAPALNPGMHQPETLAAHFESIINRVWNELPEDGL